MIVPALCVGMHSVSLRVTPQWARNVGTIKGNGDGGCLHL